MTDRYETARALVAPGKGILAADESIATMSRRLEAAGVAASETARRDYRAMLLTTPGLSQWVSGMILCDETLRQQLRDGTAFPAAGAERDIAVGIKVDTGVVPMPGTDGVVTEGLDGLAQRLTEYRELGATFAKWRAVLSPSDPDRRVTLANAESLARYAVLCQQADIVPIVEPEVVMDGMHGIEACQAATDDALATVFGALERMGADPAAMVLKPNMVIAGSGFLPPSPPDEVARRTWQVLSAVVPPSVPGIAFLSGGQSNERACANLAAINARAGKDAPWRLTYSFGRALVDDALRTWHGEPAKAAAAQDVLAANCARASAAADPDAAATQRLGA